jgi:predicted ATPase
LRSLPDPSEDAYVAGNPRWAGHDRMVVVSGCSGGGKSALIAALAARGHGAFPEPGRQVVKEALLVGEPALPWSDPARFAERCIARAAWFFNMADPAAGPVFFDRGVVDAVTALERNGAVPGWCAEAARRYRYGRRVFLVPPWEALFAGDTERRHGFAEAVAEYEALLASYAAKGYECVVIPRASLAERVAFVEAELDGV